MALRPETLLLPLQKHRQKLLLLRQRHRRLLRLRPREVTPQLRKQTSQKDPDSVGVLCILAIKKLLMVRGVFDSVREIGTDSAGVLSPRGEGHLHRSLIRAFQCDERSVQREYLLQVFEPSDGRSQVDDKLRQIRTNRILYHEISNNRDHHFVHDRTIHGTTIKFFSLSIPGIGLGEVRRHETIA